MTDNDLYFTPSWLTRLLNAAKKGEPDEFRVLGGWNHPFLQPDVSTRVFAVPYIAPGDYGLRSHDAVTGASQLMRWETWERYGPLDAHAKGVGQSEDWKFCQDVIKDGGKCGSVYPRVVFNCGVTDTYGRPATGQEVMIKELVEAKKEYPDLVWA
jgi:hypothetical protein